MDILAILKAALPILGPVVFNAWETDFLPLATAKVNALTSGKDEALLALQFVDGLIKLEISKVSKI